MPSQMASLGHLRRCEDADTSNKCLSREKDASILALDTGQPSQMAASGHLRRCSDADTTNKCLSREKDCSILSWPTVMGH
eukprot:scaffold28646_cov78-Skeletonema_dohrnii-CCMP3373.AAC.1